MLRDMEQMMARYGSPMVLVKGEQELQIRGFLQESRSHSQENAQRAFGPLGEVPKGLYVYLGPVEPEAETGDSLIFDHRIFAFRRAEPVMAGEKTAYIWGICVEKGGAADWGG